MISEKNNTSIQSVERALSILELLKVERSGLGITDIAKQLKVSKSTAHRLITSLSNFGYVKKDQVTEKYILSLKLLELGDSVLQSLDIRSIASPHLKDLAHELEETVHLVFLENSEIVYIDKIESPQTIRMYSRIGKRAPVHCTGVGKAILAYLDPSEIDTIIMEKGLKKFTDYTHITRESLLNELRNIRNNRYSVDEQEHELGIRCVAAPIFDHSNKVVAGISVAAPIYRLELTKVELYAEKITNCARNISKELGNQAI
ncbi:IclR family transcriptional regulator [Bacillus sp. PS06]|uniref:IclR family transcriptional regulator n=1 Tax=Bacillus sp. PS06 TaxID=2764176 RepID=UPI00178067A3|nr:IclR family transcriptional regulator [Bacillus sp. PS06]MBD8068627.1 IclR family transcriptional regulator [Bacillus sp. PS06]